jgi:mannose-6-phosphate isomerase-like protein (cupin superfamily)
MRNQAGIVLSPLNLAVPPGPQPVGARVLEALVAWAELATAKLHELRDRGQSNAMAVVGRVRGTGRGVSFTRLVAEMERAFPLELIYPFEGSERVGGAVWVPRDLVGSESTTSVAKLRWDSRATDLPMHVHDHSDRFIIVVKGRGFFHVTDETVDAFTGTKVRSVPARERDIFLFARGTVHTFSTDEEPMVLLSCQLPYVPFDDPTQYRLPTLRWTAREYRQDHGAGVACDPAWSVIAQRPAPPRGVFLDAIGAVPC